MSAPLDLAGPAFLARLEKLDIVARKILSGEFRGDVRTRRRGAGSLFRGHKNYTQGDDLRFLDWNVYSRLGELLVKEFDAEENLNLLLVLDASASMDFGCHNKLDFSRSLAAALGFIALNRQARVDLLILPAAGRLRRETFVGRSQVASFLRVLQDVRGGGDFDLLQSLRQAVGRRRGRGVALIISDFFAEGGYERALQFLRHAGLRTAVLHVLDREELRPRLSGRTRLVDMESGLSLKRDMSFELMEAYAREVRQWCEGVAQFCHSHEMAYVRLDTSWSLEQVVTRALLRGGILA